QPSDPAGAASWAPLTTGTVAVSSGDPTGFQVETIDTTSRQVLFRFDPYPGFRGGVNTALGDVNGDGVPDLITAPGPGGPPNVKVFNGRDGSLLLSYNAYDGNALGGVNLAAGDLDHDGKAEIITAPV